MQNTFIIKVDVDTERGTRIGVPNLVALLKELKLPATFLFSLGPDNTGRALKRVFRRGFLRKVSRTSVVSTYGVRTLLNGLLLPGPHIGKRHAALLRDVYAQGFEVGIHAYDHVKWQDGIAKMSERAIQAEFERACEVFESIFGMPSKTAGAPGWQANAKTFAAYDAANILYASDCRGGEPFFPKTGSHSFRMLQIPTTLPTLDELLGRPEFPLEKIIPHYLALLRSGVPNVLTVHAELEGMKYFEWFTELLLALKQLDVTFLTLANVADHYLSQREQIPVCEVIQGEIDGRSGLLAMQGFKITG